MNISRKRLVKQLALRLFPPSSLPLNVDKRLYFLQIAGLKTQIRDSRELVVKPTIVGIIVPGSAGIVRYRCRRLNHYEYDNGTSS